MTTKTILIHQDIADLLSLQYISARTGLSFEDYIVWLLSQKRHSVSGKRFSIDTKYCEAIQIQTDSEWLLAMPATEINKTLQACLTSYQTAGMTTSKLIYAFDKVTHFVGQHVKIVQRFHERWYKSRKQTSKFIAIRDLVTVKIANHYARRTFATIIVAILSFACLEKASGVNQAVWQNGLKIHQAEAGINFFLNHVIGLGVMLLIITIVFDFVLVDKFSRQLTKIMSRTVVTWGVLSLVLITVASDTKLACLVVTNVLAGIWLLTTLMVAVILLKSFLKMMSGNTYTLADLQKLTVPINLTFYGLDDLNPQKVTLKQAQLLETPSYWSWSNNPHDYPLTFKSMTIQDEATQVNN